MKIKELLKNKDRLYLVIITLCLTAYHTWQYVMSGYRLNALLRVVMYLVFAVTTFFLGKKALYTNLIIFALVASYFNSFINFTSFFVILLSCRINRKTETKLLILYAVNESIALMIQHYEISHLIIHALTCLFFYQIYFYINKPAGLELTEDEIKILEELNEKKLMKACTSFSKNTMTQKLQEARKRNNISTNAELLAEYNMQKKVR